MLHARGIRVYGRKVVGSRYSVVQNVALLGSVLPVVFAALLVDTLDWSPYFLCAALGVVVALALRPLLARVRRGSAALVAGEVAPEHAPGGFVLWLAPPLWCVALGLFANAWLDPSPPTAHASEVLRRVSKSKGPDRIILRGFRPGEAELGVSANSPAVRVASVGQPVTITTRVGLFGWTRIESITPR